MRLFLVALTLIGMSFTLTGSAQTASKVPQKYRDADAPTLFAAAKAGDTAAMLWLGVKYSNYHQDVPRDDVQATAWFRKAAEAGDPSGMYWAGIAFWSGRGIAQDMVEARKWMDLSAKYGNVALREQATGVLDGLTRVMTPQMISDAKAREADWVRAFEKQRKE